MAKRLLAALLFALSLGADEIKEAYYKSYDYEKMGDYADAIKVLRPIYDKYPNGYTLNLRLGWLFYKMGRYANAIEHYRRASMALPASLEPKLGMALVYLSIGRYKDAERMAATVIHSDYYNYYGNLYLSKAYLGKGRFKEAAAVAKKMLALYPTDVHFLELLAKAYESIDSNLAKKVYGDILILDPNNIAAREYLR
jgi:tetratricopeptide (TPR) repeat protein